MESQIIRFQRPFQIYESSLSLQLSGHPVFAWTLSVKILHCQKFIPLLNGSNHYKILISIVLKLISWKTSPYILVFSLEQHRIDIVSCEFLLTNIVWSLNDCENDSRRGNIEVIVCGSILKKMASQRHYLKITVI